MPPGPLDMPPGPLDMPPGPLDMPPGPPVELGGIPDWLLGKLVFGIPETLLPGKLPPIPGLPGGMLEPIIPPGGIGDFTDIVEPGLVLVIMVLALVLFILLATGLLLLELVVTIPPPPPGIGDPPDMVGVTPPGPGPDIFPPGGPWGLPGPPMLGLPCICIMLGFGLSSGLVVMGPGGPGPRNLSFIPT